MKNLSQLFIFVLSLSAVISCSSSSNNVVSNSDSTKTETVIESPYSDYNSVVKMKDSLTGNFPGEVKIELDLNGDSKNEEFLAVEGYSRGNNYAVYTSENGNWKLISAEGIPSGHLGITKLETKNNGWFDFVAMQPSGRDGIIETYYTWKNNQYVLKEQKEVTY